MTCRHTWALPRRYGVIWAVVALLLLAATHAPWCTAQEESAQAADATAQQAPVEPAQALPPGTDSDGAESVPVSPPDVPLYMNPWWLLLFACSLTVWIYVVSWVNADSRGVGMDYPIVTLLFLTLGAIGVLFTVLFHAAFSFLTLFLVLGGFLAYAVKRNQIVPEQHKLFGRAHRARVLSGIPGLGSFITAETAERRGASKVPVTSQHGDNLDDVVAERPQFARAADILVDCLVRAQGARASRVRVYPGEADYAIQYQLDGFMHTGELLPEGQAQLLLACVCVFLGLADEGRIRQGTAKMKAEFTGTEEVEIQATVLSVRGRPALSLEFPDWTADLHKHGLEALGMHPAVHKRIRSALQQDRGTIVVCGLPHSGVTTTLYAVTEEIDIFTTDVLAVEPEPEYDLESVRRWSLDTDQPWQKAYAALMREDPEALMFYELDEPERATSLLTFAADKGLVITALEAADAPEGLIVLKKLAGEPALIGRAVTCVISQRLVRRLCPECKEEVEPNPALLQKLGVDPTNPGTWYRPIGCESCLGSGYRGRTAVFGMLILTEPVAEALARSGVTAADIRSAAGEVAFRSMYRDGVAKITSGVTDLKEVRRVLKNGPKARPKAGGER